MKKIVVYIFMLPLLLANSCGNKSKMVITSVYEGETGRDILYDTKETKGNLFISDNFYLFTIMDKTEDNTWIIVERAPAIVGEGRVETVLQLYNIPESRQIILEDIDPSYSVYGSRFEKKDGKDCLIIALGDGVNETTVLLSDLLEKAKSAGPEKTEMISETQAETEQVTSAESVSEPEFQKVVLLKIGTEEGQIGQGMAEKQLEGGRFVYAVPSFAAYKNQLFIIDAINFRILVYDYSGNFIRSISYPEKSENGSVNIIRDICVDEGVLYLAAVYTNVVYVEDSETEDIIEIITGSDTQKGKFGYLDILALDHEKNLLVSDYDYNILYVYKKDVNGIHLLKSLPYNEIDQLAFDTEGNNYSTVSDGQEVTVSDSQGNVLCSFLYKSPTGNSHIIDIDDNNVIYILTKEEEAPGAQYENASYLKVIQQDGTMLDDIPVPVWPGGGMTKYVVVDGPGNVFVGTYDFTGTESEDDPPTGVLISKVK
ncbi:MAG: hypothetical protein A2V64_04800 [Bacteroidetes bacterium RBG_13_43_22]|nr:MAG: hypothetical protein A2V64_04800 [Bacteroidetes bacterium RBG_13_43_22]